MPHVHDDVVHRLAVACHSGDVIAIEAALDPDAVAVCDSGGRVPAPIRPVRGAAAVALLLHVLLLRVLRPGTDLTVESVNGSAALVARRIGLAVTVIAVGCCEDRVVNLWIVLNPDKLRVWHQS
jgi:hypothetical protein